MPTGLLPLAVAQGPDAPITDPQAVVEGFLAAMAAGDPDGAAAFVDEEITYVNVGLPTVQGKGEVAKVLRLLERPESGFEVYLHAISADGPTVLTERTDVLLLGPVRLQFWVWGRFDVRDGRITLWRDSFDFLDILKATVRGLLGLVLPGARPRPPSDPADPPGR